MKNEGRIWEDYSIHAFYEDNLVNYYLKYLIIQNKIIWGYVIDGFPSQK